MTNNSRSTSSWKVYLFSAIIALAVSFAVIKGYEYTQKDEVTITQVKGVEGKQVLYTADADGNIKPLDFTDTSKEVLDAVVHIKSIQTRSQNMGGARELPDPFKEFFGDMFKGQIPKGACSLNQWWVPALA